MKVLIIAVLMLSSVQSFSVEFQKCIDKKGQQHFTNLPAQSLDSNCKQKTDRYSYLLNQDYSNLDNKFNNYTEPVEAEEEIDKSLLRIDNFIDPVKDTLDPDKTL